MGWLSVFRGKKNASASEAKNRLQLVIAEQRSSRHRPNYLQDLKRELLEVIYRYEQIDKNKVVCNVEKEGELTVFELNIPLEENK